MANDEKKAHTKRDMTYQDFEVSLSEMFKEVRELHTLPLLPTQAQIEKYQAYQLSLNRLGKKLVLRGLIKNGGVLGEDIVGLDL